MRWGWYESARGPHPPNPLASTRLSQRSVAPPLPPTLRTIQGPAQYIRSPVRTVLLNDSASPGGGGAGGGVQHPPPPRTPPRLRKTLPGPSLYKVPTYSTRAGAAPRAPGGARHGGGNRAANSQPRTGQSTLYGDVKSSYGGAGGWDRRGCAT